MEFKYGHEAGKSSIKHTGKSLAKYLSELLSENDKTSGRPIKALLAEKAIQIALDEKTSHKDFMYLIEQFMDRETGKPTNVNLNADISANPFDGIDTAKLEALKKRLEEIKA